MNWKSQCQWSGGLGVGADWAQPSSGLLATLAWWYKVRMVAHWGIICAGNGGMVVDGSMMPVKSVKSERIYAKLCATASRLVAEAAVDAVAGLCTGRLWPGVRHDVVVLVFDHLLLELVHHHVAVTIRRVRLLVKAVVAVAAVREVRRRERLVPPFGQRNAGERVGHCVGQLAAE